MEVERILTMHSSANVGHCSGGQWMVEMDRNGEDPHNAQYSQYGTLLRWKMGDGNGWNGEVESNGITFILQQL